MTRFSTTSRVFYYRLLVACAFALSSGARAATPATIDGPYFSPHGGVTEAVVRELSAARHEVRVQAYSFTSAPIAKALVEAKRRGVDVQILADKSNRTGKYSAATADEQRQWDQQMRAGERAATRKEPTTARP